ncbi:MAG: radical SAM protein [Candidatus Bathyarchaeota archaeon]|nr:radical SAM protein [Candidatus Bathyarchaeota archaeon]
MDRDSRIPLIGCIAFGVVDRGTNLLQVRPTTICNLSCIYCSTDAGPRSRVRSTEYIVDPDYLYEWVLEVVRYKGSKGIELHIDTVGEPTTYPYLVDLVQKISSIDGVEVVSMQSNGILLDEGKLEDLRDAGLSRPNLSIDTLDPEKARFIAGDESYDVDRVKTVAEYAAGMDGLDLLVAPVWIPGVNDQDIPEIIEYSLRIGAGKRWPPLGIQKYEVHKRGRKPYGVKPFSWGRFYRELRRLERIYNVKLVLGAEDFGIHPRPMIPSPLTVGMKVEAEIVAPGWLRGELLAVAKGRVITVVGVGEELIGRRVYLRMIGCKHNVYLARIEG